MRSITFPNGLTLTSTALSPQDVEKLFQLAVMQILGMATGTVAQGTTVQDSDVLAVDDAGTIANGQSILAVGVAEDATVASISGLNVTMSAPASASQTSPVAIGSSEAAYYAVRVGWLTEGSPAWAIDEDVVTITATPVDNPYNRIRDVSQSPNDAVSNTQTTDYTRAWEMHFSIYGPNALDNARLINSCLRLDWVRAIFGISNLYLIPDSAEPLRAPELFSGEWWDRADFRARYYEGVEETIAQQTVATAEVILDAAIGGYGEGGYGDNPYGDPALVTLDFTVSTE